MKTCTIVHPNKKFDYDQMLKIIKSANLYQSYIVAKGDSTEVNMKNLMSLSLLAHFKGGFEIKAMGDDAQEAINHIEKFI